MTIIKVKNKSDIVADNVIDMILNEELKPGDRLPVESTLAENFGVSRITIREAFKKLSVMGVVNIRQGDGTYVADFSPKDFMKPLLPMLLLNEKDIGDLYDVRRALECGAARSAAINRTENDIILLKNFQDSMNRHFNNYSQASLNEYAKADRNFHITIVKASNNEYFTKVYETIYDVLAAGINKTSSTGIGRKASIKEHSAIIDALVKKDSDAAEKLMSEHLINAKNFMLSSIE